ncbi:MAG: hypothetical protein ACSNEK_06115 [Parachlamydiaceae bacterium]
MIRLLWTSRKKLMKKAEAEVVKSYQDAFLMRSSIAEPLYRLSSFLPGKQM